MRGTAAGPAGQLLSPRKCCLMLEHARGCAPPSEELLRLVAMATPGTACTSCWLGCPRQGLLLYDLEAAAAVAAAGILDELEATAPVATCLLLQLLLEVTRLLLLTPMLLLTLAVLTHPAGLAVCLLLSASSGTPCIISLWLTTSIGTTTACVERDAAAPPAALAMLATAVGEKPSCSPSFVVALFVTSKEVK